MTIELLAPAKVNLGLEVIRKRDDGFHEIATVFQTISIFDRLWLEPSAADSVGVTNRIEPIEENLVTRTLELARANGLTSQHWRVDIEKRIPLAAGLGGASTDAAATLAGICAPGVGNVDQTALALGSDVPFLCNGGAALARGRGELLEPLPRLSSCWFVLATPAIELERKTARLYGALERGDFSDGARVSRGADALRSGRIPAPDDLANAFHRPLSVLLPALTELHDAFRAAGAPFVALTGAGPTHYSILPELGDALSVARQLSSTAPVPMRVMLARPTAFGFLLRKKTIAPGKTL